MAVITICSDFGAQENKVWHYFHCLPIYFPWGNGTDPAEAWPWGATSRPRSGVATESARLRQRRSGGREDLPHARGQGRCWEELPRQFLFQCPIILPFHTVHGVLKARILKWFAIVVSSGPHSVSPLHHDPSILGGPTRHGLVPLS